MTIVITAPEHMQHPDWPVVFLAGPIVGARRWQDEAIAMLTDPARDFYIANPRRAVDRWEDFKEKDYQEQIEWEITYLGIAGHGHRRRGAVFFWLAAEERHTCERAFAQTTRFELGEKWAWASTGGMRGALVVGGEPGFPGLRYIKYRCARHGMPFHDSFDDAIASVSVEIDA